MDYIIAFGQVKRYLAEAGERSFQNKSRVFRVNSEDYTLTAEGSARSRQSDGRRDASPQDLETPRSKRNPTIEANRDERSLMDRVEELETANALLLDKWERQECSWCGTKQSLGPSAP